MEGQALREARICEQTRERNITAEERPVFHLSSRVGWMNDPNGFSWYDGCYHMFYQYHPYDSHWGPMHWGHAVSTDLLHWEYRPAVLAPDLHYDHAGCFSGSAVTLDDGTQLLMYTSVAQTMDENGKRRDVQTQSLAVGDGHNYQKYHGNPVLGKDDIPDNGSIYDFRDPRMWREPDGSFRMILVNNDKYEGGQVLLYSSPDGFRWKYERKLLVNHFRFGKMWECPDLFELDGKQVFLFSAMDMIPKDFEYHNGNGTVCLVGSIDPVTGDFAEEHDQTIDYGIDFYAPQTVVTPDGRRVMIGWMQNWDTCNLHMESRSWFGQMSVPRELSVRNGRLFQQPIREIESLRIGEPYRGTAEVEDGELFMTGLSGRIIDMEVEVEPSEPDETFHQFAVKFAQDEICYTKLGFRPKESVMKIDRKFSGSRRAIIHQRRAKVRHENGKIKFRILLDRFSVEVFVNDGEQVLTATLYTDIAADRISFVADGSVKVKVTKYDLGA